LGELNPALFLKGSDSDEDYQLSALRDITFDDEGNIYIFKYDDNFIKKYDSKGRHLLTFGGKGEEAENFTHLTAIKVIEDRLYALDSVGYLTFTLNGEFIDKTSFAKEIICDFPKISQDRRFCGEIISEEIKKILTLRNPDGIELIRIAQHDLREFFPELKEGNQFFINEIQTRSYLYDFSQDGNIIWCASDKCKIYEYDKELNQSKILTTLDFNPLSFPREQIIELKKRKEKIRNNPMLHLYIPNHYQLVQHLNLDEEGNIWVYVISQEKKGFLVLSPDGTQIGFYKVISDLDMSEVVVRIFKDRIYFIQPETDCIYLAQI